MMRELLSTVLHSLGVRQIVVAEDGISAREKMEILNPDVALLDILMPGIDGIALCRQVREGKTKVHPFVPIIMVSGFSDVNHVAAARDAGANDFLSKPLTATRLYAKLSALVEQTRPFVRATGFVGPDRRRRTERRHGAAPTPAGRRQKERRGCRGAAQEQGSPP